MLPFPAPRGKPRPGNEVLVSTTVIASSNAEGAGDFRCSCNLLGRRLLLAGGCRQTEHCKQRANRERVEISPGQNQELLLGPCGRWLTGKSTFARSKEKKNPEPSRSQVKQRGKRILQSPDSTGQISLEDFWKAEERARYMTRVENHPLKAETLFEVAGPSQKQ